MNGGSALPRTVRTKRLVIRSPTGTRTAAIACILIETAGWIVRVRRSAGLHA
jgi:hypothetical protein